MFDRLKKKKSNKVLVRVCIGCVLPNDAELIGSGVYDLIITGSKISEKYYDYIINDDDLDFFLDINKNILIKYKLLDVEVKPEDKKDKNPVKETTIRGWNKKDYPN